MWEIHYIRGLTLSGNRPNDPSIHGLHVPLEQLANQTCRINSVSLICGLQAEATPASVTVSQLLPHHGRLHVLLAFIQPMKLSSHLIKSFLRLVPCPLQELAIPTLSVPACLVDRIPNLPTLRSQTNSLYVQICCDRLRPSRTLSS